MATNMNRRRFLGSAVASGAFTVVPSHVLGGRRRIAPSDRITLAHVGMGTQSFRELGALLEEQGIQIVAVCDPNKDSSDYIEWGKGSVLRRIRSLLGDSSWRANEDGCPGGRDVGCEVINTWYAKNRGRDKFRGCTAYADYREMLTNEKDLDAVKIMTPDHLHAVIAVAAMKKGMHVMTHKPIANRLHEGRVVLDTARRTGLATHLLAYGSGTANGLIVERIKQGVIGRLREIHNWTNRPVWPQYTQIPSDKPPIPKGLDWDLWLGPEKYRPYHPHYTHTVFRGWYDFGGGSMADMGIYSLWPVFTGLDLAAPVSAQAWATHSCIISDNVSRTIKNDFSFPTACQLRFEFADGLELFWYDGGMKPRLPEEVEAHDVQMDREGILYVGDKGSIMAEFHGRDPQLFLNGGRKRLEVPEAPARRGHLSNWLPACRTGKQSPGSFLNAAGITDTVNLGAVALRCGEKVLFDSEKMKITNSARADKYLYRDYREGWQI